VVILGAAGRDFHNFNLLFRGRDEFEVVAFTAAQIPDIEGRSYPAALAGELYPDGIPIVAEDDLERLLRDRSIDEAWFSYSDLAHVDVMHIGSRVIAAGAHFVLASATQTMLVSSRPVIAITAVRTGVGKSQTTRYVSRLLKAMGKRVVAVRHPMPYGDLSRQICQRFATYDDLDVHECTIEEREEYEPHIDSGFVVYSGVDYERILREAEKEADVILWDGGNKDTSFFKPDLQITLVDPARRPDRRQQGTDRRTRERRGRRAELPPAQPGGDDRALRFRDPRRRPGGHPRQARAGGRGRSDADPRRHELRRRLVRRQGRRGSRDRRSFAVCGRLARRDLRAIPERPRHPAGDGLR
jgi:hypothetical protein